MWFFHFNTFIKSGSSKKLRADYTFQLITNYRPFISHSFLFFKSLHPTNFPSFLCTLFPFTNYICTHPTCSYKNLGAKLHSGLFSVSYFLLQMKKKKNKHIFYLKKTLYLTNFGTSARLLSLSLSLALHISSLFESNILYFLISYIF